MTLAQRLQQLRLDARLTQEQMAETGVVSAPGWIKLENGQRQPSEKLIDGLVDWLVREKHLPAKNRAPLRDELLTLKYLEATKHTFLASLARSYAGSTLTGQQLLTAFDEARKVRAKPKRGRPAGRVFKR